MPASIGKASQGFAEVWCGPIEGAIDGPRGRVGRREMRLSREISGKKPKGPLSAKQPFIWQDNHAGFRTPMLAQQLTTKSKADRSRFYPNTDAKLIGLIASGDDKAVGVFVDRWMSAFFKFTDSFRLNEADGEIVAEEVFRRVMFEAPRFVAKPEKFTDWLRGTIRDCTAATVMKPKSPALFESLAPSISPAAMSCSALLRESRVDDALSFLNS
ncbi:MAG: hypothetical protein ABJC63_09295, partial [Gemmatimonadales bacterium]